MTSVLYMSSTRISPPTPTMLGDISLTWTPGGILCKSTRVSPPIPTMKGDISIVWAPGGLKFQSVRVSPPAITMKGDISLIWFPGGIKFHSTRVSPPIPTMLGDIFILKAVTLALTDSDYYISRQVLQPPGIPWLSTEVTTAAWCWKLSLLDGTVLGFTSHDIDLVLSGITYLAASGFDPSSVDTSNDLSVDNLDLAGMLDNEIIKEDDLRQGRYDYAKIEIFMCNYTNLKDTLFMIRKGYLGKVTYGKNGFSAEVRGLMEAYAQQSGKVCQKTCRATLGDIRCGINVDAYATAGSVTSLNIDGTFQTNISRPNAYFAYGIIKWTSGLNTGISYEVKESYSSGAIDLFLPTVHAVGIGDTFILYVGCDRNATTCRSKFGNLINFRGELYTPGNQYVASYTDSGSNNTVADGANVQRGDYDWG